MVKFSYENYLNYRECLLLKLVKHEGYYFICQFFMSNSMLKIKCCPIVQKLEDLLKYLIFII